MEESATFDENCCSDVKPNKNNTKWNMYPKPIVGEVFHNVIRNKM